MLKVLYMSPITSASVRQFLDLVSPFLDQKDSLAIYLDSPGGEVPAALALAHFLRRIEGGVTTCNWSRCDSSAIAVFASGRRRLVRNGEVKFGFHPVQVELNGKFCERELVRCAETLRQSELQLAAHLAKSVGHTEDFWRRKMHESESVNGVEALSCGLATWQDCHSADSFDIKI